jgi:hypothetical protein
LGRDDALQVGVHVFLRQQERLGTEEIQMRAYANHIKVFKI